MFSVCMEGSLADLWSIIKYLQQSYEEMCRLDSRNTFNNTVMALLALKENKKFQKKYPKKPLSMAADDNGCIEEMEGKGWKIVMFS